MNRINFVLSLNGTMTPAYSQNDRKERLLSFFDASNVSERICESYIRLYQPKSDRKI